MKVNTAFPPSLILVSKITRPHSFREPQPPPSKAWSLVPCKSTEIAKETFSIISTTVMNSSTLVYHKGLSHLSLKYTLKGCVFDNISTKHLRHVNVQHFRCLLPQPPKTALWWFQKEHIYLWVWECLCGLFLIYLHSSPQG